MNDVFLLFFTSRVYLNSYKEQGVSTLDLPRIIASSAHALLVGLSGLCMLRQESAGQQGLLSRKDDNANVRLPSDHPIPAITPHRALTASASFCCAPPNKFPFQFADTVTDKPCLCRVEFIEPGANKLPVTRADTFRVT